MKETKLRQTKTKVGSNNKTKAALLSKQTKENEWHYLSSVQ